jgi:hypothetical protein
MTIRSLTAGLAIAAVAAGLGASSASAETVNFDVPISAAVLNDCTGELVTINGTQHMKVTDNSSLSGIKYQVEANLTGVKGITPTGVRYVMNSQSSDMQHAEFDPFGNAQATMEQTTLLTRQAETGALLTGDDFQLKVLTHLTVSNGVVRSDKQDLRFDCR